ncbi:hypothetical protein BKA57DRAFT_18648 [Linnemannia elongata]|nr:hypothetical protein BKA57DRAFT_18648 [Linnemannia elongata]
MAADLSLLLFSTFIQSSFPFSTPSLYSQSTTLLHTHRHTRTQLPPYPIRRTSTTSPIYTLTLLIPYAVKVFTIFFFPSRFSISSFVFAPLLLRHHSTLLYSALLYPPPFKKKAIVLPPLCRRRQFHFLAPNGYQRYLNSTLYDTPPSTRLIH